MKKEVKNNLDEMQEQKLLQIEHNCCWFCFWGLLVAMIVELIVLGPENWKALAAEWIIFMCMCLYLSIACMKQGIWDRRLKATPLTNLLMSLGAAFIIGVCFFVVSYKNWGYLSGAIATAVFCFVITFVLCFIALTIAAHIYQVKSRKLEEEE